MSNPPEQLHRPLSRPRDIRLVALQPGAQRTPLRCSLMNVSLDDRPHYEAVSYVWAQSLTWDKAVSSSSEGRFCIDFQDSVSPHVPLPNQHTIECDGSSLSLTENLEAALHRFRLENATRLLWVDQICIDQTNPQERGAQVLLMRDIYERASQVLVWLGEEIENVGEVFARMQDIPAPPVKLETLYIWFVSDDGFDAIPDGHQIQTFKEGIARFDETRFQALETMYHRPWFQRLWVCQEGAMNAQATVICGAKSVPLLTLVWFTIYGFVSKVFPEVFSDLSVNAAFRMCRIIADWRGSPDEGFDLLWAYSNTEYCETSEPRDKIFALLGFTGRYYENSVLRPDYSKPIERIYAEAAQAHMTCHKSLRVLSVVPPERDGGGLHCKSQSLQFVASLCQNWRP